MGPLFGGSLLDISGRKEVPFLVSCFFVLMDGIARGMMIGNNNYSRVNTKISLEPPAKPKPQVASESSFVILKDYQVMMISGVAVASQFCMGKNSSLSFF
jgi:hypothetical protein